MPEQKVKREGLKKEVSLKSFMWVIILFSLGVFVGGVLNDGVMVLTTIGFGFLYFMSIITLAYLDDKGWKLKR